MPPETRAGESYAVEVGELWSGLATTLVRLETLAAEPELLESDAAMIALRRLQYQLHLAGEHTLGLAPPAGSEGAHTELAAALFGARDATAEIVEAAEMAGLDAVETIVHEWRGALFRVRLARLRLARPTIPDVAAPEPRPRLGPSLLASALAVLGAAAFALGATTGAWPIWVAGMIVLCGSLLAHRP